MRFILFLTFLPALLFARPDEKFGKIGKYSIEADYIFGRILAHNSRFKPRPTEFTHGFEIAAYKQTLGTKEWQRKLQYPELGAAFTFFRHGDYQYFGDAYMLMGVAKFWIVRSRYVDFYVRAGSGIAIVPRHFNLQTNPENVVIGSTLNSSAQVKLGIDIKPHPNLQLTMGVSFTHYSNSAVQFPNLGVNTPAVFFGLRYFPCVSDSLRYNRAKWSKPKKRHEVMIKYSMGIQESRPYKGAKFPVYIGTINYAYYTSIVNKVLGGASVEFNQAAYDLIGYYGNDFKYNRTLSSMNISLFAGDEVIMGKVGIYFMAGVYLLNPRKDAPMYVKIGANYYFVSVGKNKNTKFFIGSNLKTHFFVAQFYEMCAGVAF